MSLTDGARARNLDLRCREFVGASPAGRSDDECPSSAMSLDGRRRREFSPEVVIHHSPLSGSSSSLSIRAHAIHPSLLVSLSPSTSGSSSLSPPLPTLSPRHLGSLSSSSHISRLSTQDEEEAGQQAVNFAAEGENAQRQDARVCSPSEKHGRHRGTWEQERKAYLERNSDVYEVNRPHERTVCVG